MIVLNKKGVQQQPAVLRYYEMTAVGKLIEPWTVGMPAENASSIGEAEDRLQWGVGKYYGQHGRQIGAADRYPVVDGNCANSMGHNTDECVRTVLE